MAATFWPAAMNVFSLLFILIFIASPFSLSQSISPQNIQTFYPFFLPPLQPPRIPVRRRVQPPPPPPPPEPAAFLPPPQFLLPPPSAPSRKAVGTAIGVTAASTVVLSALFFFFVVWYLRSRREKGGAAASAANSAATAAAVGGGGGENKAAGNRDEFLRFEGNLKAVIVDEDGLDVLYWRKLEGGEGKESFDRQLFSNIESDRKDDEKRMIARGGGRKKPGPPVQEIPLLRGKSSTSQLPVWGESENQEAASFPAAAAAAPPLSVQAIPKTLTPPPKPDSLASSSSSEHGVSGNEEEEEKVNPLHLDNVSHSSMDWNKIEDGSYKFDGDLMEALFGTVATNRKSPRTDNNSPSTPREIAGPPSQIFILETKKSQEFATLIKSLNATRKEIMNALDNGVGLDAETLEKLSKLAITKEEESDILGFEGPPTRLADAESFLFFILKPFPSAFHRFNAMLLRSRFGSEIIHLKADFQTLEIACNELRNSRLFIKLLEAILKAWNRMNAGSSRGNGHGFKLSALRKLYDVKSVDGNITVLQFVVQEVIRAEGKRCFCSRDHRIISNVAIGGDDEREKEYMTLGLPVVGGLSSEFTGVKKAAGIDYNSLSAAHSVLSSKASEIGKLAAQCGDDGGGFTAEMRRFLNAAEEEMKAVREEKTRAMEMVKKTTEYYQRGSSNDRTWPPLQLFIVVKDFLGMIDEACVEIARNLQRKRPAGSSSLPSRTVRFPRLPADFLSEQAERSSDSVQDS